ncbi:1-acyl-sn-glycerol-3-phosphate acyltransferase [Pseudomethylobacillus aquaticus]|uniref:1-acyl-sn-glycerol-3-phosphate acyltransferase n=1 Tax=Pseudomethylobacillus aquaticus TaxID=2676064 RepID=A0A3N0V101_9PROT|nr:lysophospholipid acyltransferase family protein [Pseudomethylobacillus aquaticus]ROH86234.1 1-acyl-sn-glycerol-3-phosphate acyltransferase [Pseudomethylobacillus aquaticus]
MVLHTVYGVMIAGLLLPHVKPAWRDRLISHWCRGLLSLLNVTLRVHGTPPPFDSRNIMLVGNHISWLDIHALNSVKALRFVAKSEIRGWPVFGWFSEKVNTLFTERTRKQDAGRMVDITAEALRSGDCICFFPEGTTSDGSHILPFKGSLMQAAINADSMIWPVTIRYPDANDQPNVAMAYYGDISLQDSIFSVIGQKAPVVELHFGSPIAAHGHERRGLSLLARQAIASNFPNHPS